MIYVRKKTPERLGLTRFFPKKMREFLRVCQGNFYTKQGSYRGYEGFLEIALERISKPENMAVPT